MSESRQYTALAFCAFKNHSHCFKMIYEHGKEHNLQKDQDRQRQLSQWADMPTDEKFLAVHFACYHSNLEMIKILVEEMNTNYLARNLFGANVLHISAQGDSCSPLVYFIKVKHMNIDDKDARGGTPLHWACYSKAEFALSYILAMEPDLEIADKEGMTALHVAIKVTGELKNIRPVRALLLKGAKRSARTNKGQTCQDLVRPDFPPHIKDQLTEILKEPVYLECFLVKVPLVPIRKSHKTQVLFIALFLVIYFT